MDSAERKSIILVIVNKMGRTGVMAGPILFLLAIGLYGTGISQDIKRKLVVIAEKAPVYLESSVSSPVIGYLPEKTALVSYRIENGLYRIMLPSGRGDVSSFGYLAPEDVKILEEESPAGPDFWGTEEKKYRGIGLDILLGGGATFFSGGDITDGARGLCEELIARLGDEGFSISDRDIGTFRSGAHFYPDLVFHLGPRLSIGIGGEYLSAGNLDSFSFMESGVFRTANGNLTLKAFLIRPGVHITFPLGGGLSVRATGGPIFAGLNFKYDRSYETTLTTENLYLNAKDKSIGIQAGVALEIQLNERIGVFLGAHGQVARAMSLEGDEQLLRLSQDGLNISEPKKTGTVKFTSRNGFPVLTVPGDDGLPGAKNAVFDFSGFGLSAGLKVRI
jgi:hypothetical protein